MMCQGALAKPERGFRVGLIAGTTGLASFAGEAVRRAVESTDRDKDRDNRVTFLFEDDGFQPKNVPRAAEKLISRDRVDALITFSGSTSLVVAPLAERRKGADDLDNVSHRRE